MSLKLKRLQDEIISCTKCPRLVAWREQVAREKVRRFADEDYWGKPIPSFGDPKARLFIVGLAPAAHGGNRTGRMFTGDRSGDWLFEALHRADFANQPNADALGDGLRLKDCYIAAAVRCAPPKNKPTTEERNNCFDYLTSELTLLSRVKVIVALGKIGFDTILKALRQRGAVENSGGARFGHGEEVQLKGDRLLIASYHPSQQNTFTGKLTKPMFDQIFLRARHHIE